MKISVITVTFNAEETIERTLLSVASQKLQDTRGEYTAEYSEGRAWEVEHWVIDGASKDATMAIVRTFAHVNSLSEPDDGLYDAMNKGLRLATGDYIVFLNAGDKLHDVHTLQHVFDAAVQSRNSHHDDAHCTSSTTSLDNALPLPAIIYGQTQLVNEEGRFIDMRNHWAPERLTMSSFARGMLVCHQSFYARADLARAEKYDLQWHFSADYDWCIRVMLRAEAMHLSMINTHYILASYLNDGMTIRNHAASLRERMHIMAHHYGWTATLLRHMRLVLQYIV